MLNTVSRHLNKITVGARNRRARHHLLNRKGFRNHDDNETDHGADAVLRLDRQDPIIQSRDNTN